MCCSGLNHCVYVRPTSKSFSLDTDNYFYYYETINSMQIGFLTKQFSITRVWMLHHLKRGSLEKKLFLSYNWKRLTSLPLSARTIFLEWKVNRNFILNCLPFNIYKSWFEGINIFRPANGIFPFRKSRCFVVKRVQLHAHCKLHFANMQHMNSIHSNIIEIHKMYGTHKALCRYMHLNFSVPGDGGQGHLRLPEVKL